MFLRMTLVALCLVPLAGCSIFSPGTDSMIQNIAATNITNTTPEAAGQNTTASFANSGNAPARMAIIWNENVLQSPGQPAKRGFVGRIYFYNANQELVQVDGELNVYLYDDSANNRSEVPDKKFVFPADNFHTHYNPSELGHAYSVWVPCANYGEMRKSISLVPVFRTTNNDFIQGRPNRLSVAGRTPQGQSVDRQMVSAPTDNFYGDNSQSQDSRQRRTSETVQVPRHIAERILNAPNSRIPSQDIIQNLNDMESPQHNPEGDLFNRVHVEQNHNNHLPVPYKHATSNFSDGGNWARPAHVRSAAPNQNSQLGQSQIYGQSPPYGEANTYGQSQPSIQNNGQPQRTQFGMPGGIR